MSDHAQEVRKRRTEREIASAEKRLQALKLRRAGANYEQIGRELSCSRQEAHRLVQTAIAEIPREAALEVRELHNARLDAMFLKVWEKASKGDKESIETALRIMARQAKLLGLDAPQKSELTGRDGGPIELAAAGDRVRSRLDRLAAASGEGEEAPDASADAGGPLSS